MIVIELKTGKTYFCGLLLYDDHFDAHWYSIFIPQITWEGWHDICQSTFIWHF